MTSLNDVDTELGLDTEVYLAIVCKIPLSAADHFKRLLTAHGSRIVYQRLAAEPLRIVAKRTYEELAQRGGYDDGILRAIS